MGNNPFPPKCKRVLYHAQTRQREKRREERKREKEKRRKYTKMKQGAGNKGEKYPKSTETQKRKKERNMGGKNYFNIRCECSLLSGEMHDGNRGFSCRMDLMR